jgi:hypothetical protein
MRAALTLCFVLGCTAGEPVGIVNVRLSGPASQTIETSATVSWTGASSGSETQVIGQDGRVAFPALSLVLGHYTFTVEVSSASTGTMVLLGASRDIDVGAGDNVVTFAPADFLPGPDDDGDGASNWSELFRGCPPDEDNGDCVWTQVAPGGGHSCAIDIASHLYCWGENDYGQTGQSPDALRAVAAPAIVQPSRTWGWVSAGELHSCGVSSDNQIHCFGNNWHGQLGGTPLADGDLVQVPFGPWLTVGAGSSTTCGIQLDGDLYCWGANDQGQAGTSGGADLQTPTMVIPAGGWSTVAGGADYTCGVQNGDVYCWGNNDDGQLGDDSFAAGETMRRVTTSGDVQRLAVGGRHACLIRSSGELWCWGGNAWGELGAVRTGVPVQIDPGETYVSVAAGYGFTCAARSPW